MKAGDWVYSSRKGIFRIERVVTRYYQAAERGILPGKWKVGDKYPSPMVLSKKAFSPDFRPRIDWDSCDAFFIRPVGPHVQKQIRSFLKTNPEFLRKFNAYQIPPVGSLYHFHLASMPNENEREQLIQFVQKGRTFRQIRSHMRKTGLDAHLGQPIVGTLMLRPSRFRSTRWARRYTAAGGTHERLKRLRVFERAILLWPKPILENTLVELAAWIDG